MMTHDEAIGMFERRIGAQTEAERPSTADMEDAERHVIHCGNCWDKLVQLWDKLAQLQLSLPVQGPPCTDRPAPPRCEQVVHELWRVVPPWRDDPKSPEETPEAALQRVAPLA